MKNAVKKYISCIFLVVAVFLLAACSSFRSSPGSVGHLQRDMGFAVREEDILEWTEVYNNYGGLQNDGELYCLIRVDLDLSDETWITQPLSEKATTFLEMTDAEIDFSITHNYCWKLIDRTPDNTPSAVAFTDASLLIYDMEAGILHWICFEI